MRFLLPLLLALSAPAVAATLQSDYAPKEDWERAVLERADSSMMFRGTAWGQPGSLWLAVKFPQNFVKNAVALDQICIYAQEEGAPSGTRIIVTYIDAGSMQQAGKAWCEVGGKLGFL